MASWTLDQPKQVATISHFTPLRCAPSSRVRAATSATLAAGTLYRFDGILNRYQ
jgi:hypothetical protein